MWFKKKARGYSRKEEEGGTDKRRHWNGLWEITETMESCPFWGLIKQITHTILTKPALKNYKFL